MHLINTVNHIIVYVVIYYDFILLHVSASSVRYPGTFKCKRILGRRMTTNVKLKVALRFINGIHWHTYACSNYWLHSSASEHDPLCFLSAGEIEVTSGRQSALLMDSSSAGQTGGQIIQQHAIQSMGVWASGLVCNCRRGCLCSMLLPSGCDTLYSSWNLTIADEPVAFIFMVEDWSSSNLRNVC
jgi:hypothetical protein